MKKSILILGLFVTAFTCVNAQHKERYFGFEVNQFVVQSGFGQGTEIQANISDNKKRTLSIGIYYDTKLNNIGGISISTQKMLGRYRKNSLPVIEPFLFYNLIYHKTEIHQQRVTDEYIVARGSYKSIENYAGIGLRVNIIPGLYFKGEIGYGAYLGSIMKPSKPDPIMNESYGTHGAGAILKIGVGTYF